MRAGMKVTGSAVVSVTPSVNTMSASTGRNADGSGEGQEMATALATAAAVEPNEVPDAFLKAQEYDLLTSKPKPEMETTDADATLRILGENDEMVGTNENRVLEPTFPISSPVFALRTVNKAMPCGRSTNAGSWQVSCPDETTRPMGEVTTRPLLNSNAQTYRVLPSVAKPAPATVS